MAGPRTRSKSRGARGKGTASRPQWNANRRPAQALSSLSIGGSRGASATLGDDRALPAEDVMPMTAITSTELDHLIWRYLQESGFTHASFALYSEAGINKSKIDTSLVPPGALVTFVQKGLQYIEMEANLDCSDVDVGDDFALLEPEELINMDVHELHQIVQERKRKNKKPGDHIKIKEKHGVQGQEQEYGGLNAREGEKGERKQERGTELESKQERKGKTKLHMEHKEVVMLDKHGICGGPEPIADTRSSLSVAQEVSRSDVTILEGHNSEVFSCAWSPAGSLLASGSGDATARIWTIPDGPCGSVMNIPLEHVQILEHFQGATNEKGRDVSALDWHAEGMLLATGSCDAHTRIWDTNGELRRILSKHRGPVLSLKWSKKGDFLVSGSVDKTAILWDTGTWECKQRFQFHAAPISDIDWRNDLSFASCSNDCMIYVCQIGEHQPTKCFAGHEGEVNSIKWDHSGSLLASCSDDGTAKIWSLKQDKCLFDLKEHSKEIYTIRWSPTCQGTVNPNQQLLLASASLDSTIKLWDVEHGRSLCTLNGHRRPVYTIEFSPDGEYLASGSLDQSLHIWSVKEGKIVKTYSQGGAGIYQVCWNKTGDRIAASYGNGKVCIMDFRM